jgi:hypothetical protein
MAAGDGKSPRRTQHLGDLGAVSLYGFALSDRRRHLELAVELVDRREIPGVDGPDRSHPVRECGVGDVVADRAALDGVHAVERSLEA